MMELNMGTLFSKLGVTIADKEERFRRFEAAARRRRLMKQDEERVNTATKAIITKLCEVSNREVPQKNEEKVKVYNTLVTI